MKQENKSAEMEVATKEIMSIEIEKANEELRLEKKGKIKKKEDTLDVETGEAMNVQGVSNVTGTDCV
jgi:hypothetical protein